MYKPGAAPGLGSNPVLLCQTGLLLNKQYKAQILEDSARDFNKVKFNAKQRERRYGAGALIQHGAGCFQLLLGMDVAWDLLVALAGAGP